MLFLICFALVSVRTFAHPSANDHFKDISSVFDGYGNDKNFKELEDVVSAGIDDHLKKAFINSIGKIPGNHRILGHGWTLNASIPQKTLDRLLQANPSKSKEEILRVWIDFARICIAKSEELSGLPKKQANAFASMIYDVHLIGDLEPDNTMTNDVLTLDLIVKNFNKDAEELFVNKPEYAKLIAEKMAEAMKLPYTNEHKASAVMQSLFDLKIGSMLSLTWGKTLKMTYSAKAIEKASRFASEHREKAQAERDKDRETDATSTKPDGMAYSRSSTGKIHTSTCQHFKAEECNFTKKPTDTNCKTCGGASK